MKSNYDPRQVSKDEKHIENRQYHICSECDVIMPATEKKTINATSILLNSPKNERSKK